MRSRRRRLDAERAAVGADAQPCQGARQSLALDDAGQPTIASAEPDASNRRRPISHRPSAARTSPTVDRAVGADQQPKYSTALALDGMNHCNRRLGTSRTTSQGPRVRVDLGGAGGDTDAALADAPEAVSSITLDASGMPTVPRM